MKLTRCLTLALALCALTSLAISTQADTAYLTIHPGENWISAPLVPYNPAPDALFGTVLAQSSLTRLDAPYQREITYNTDPAAFGNILLGDGYILNYTGSTAVTISYEGAPDGVPGSSGNMTDMWISLPGRQIDLSNLGGLHWIGHPFSHAISTDLCLVTNGTMTLTLSQAVADGWIDPLWYGLDPATKDQFTVGLSTQKPQKAYLQPGYMYKITTHRDNLALIIPANAVPEPGCLVVVLSGVGFFVGWKRKSASLVE